MSLTHDQLHHFAHALMDAGDEVKAIRPLTDEAPDLSFDDAYEIAADIIGHKIGDGRKIAGFKVGVSTAGAMKAFGMDTPAYGIYLDNMTVRSGGRIKMSTLIAPKAEAEIGFRLKAPLKGPGVTAEQVIEATDYVFPALEIVDSRFNWNVKAADLVADNTASAYVVMGTTQLPPTAIDLREEEAVMELDGVEAGRGKGKEVLGNPVNSLVWLANKLGEQGRGLAAGQFVIPGSVVMPPPLKKGDVLAVAYTSLGVVSVSFV